MEMDTKIPKTLEIFGGVVSGHENDKVIALTAYQMWVRLYRRTMREHSIAQVTKWLFRFLLLRMVHNYHTRHEYNLTYDDVYFWLFQRDIPASQKKRDFYYTKFLKAELVLIGHRRFNIERYTRLSSLLLRECEQFDTRGAKRSSPPLQRPQGGPAGTPARHPLRSPH